MSISATYLTLQQQIADELGDRQDLLAPLSDSALGLSPIKNAVQSAIAKWERERFYFNEFLLDTPLSGTPSPWQTSLGQEFYGDSSAPNAWVNPNFSTVAKIDAMWVLVGSNRYAVTPRVAQYLIDTSVNPAVTGNPTDFAYNAQQGRLYPIPDGAYQIGVLGTKRFTALAADADVNAWTQDAYDLIRSEAKLILAMEVLHDADLASACRLAIYGDPNQPKVRGYIDALKGETSRRRAQGRVRPTYF